MKKMKKICMIGSLLVLLSGCVAGTDPGLPAGPETGEQVTTEETNKTAASPAVSDADSHTLSAELMTFQGGTSGAREYVVAQAQRACESINKEVYIEKLTSQPTWRGGVAEVIFRCVDKDDPRLKEQ